MTLTFEVVSDWQIGAQAPPAPTLLQLRARYESAAAWEGRLRRALTQERTAYARALLQERPGDAIRLRARARQWRKALRDLRRAEQELTGYLLRAQTAEHAPGA